MVITFKYQLKGKRAKRQLCLLANVCNQVWNFCVATQKETQKRRREGLNGKWLNFYDINKLAKSFKELVIHSQTAQNICQQFVKSRDQHRKCPKFRKSSGSKRSLGWIPFQAQSRQINNNSITYLGNTFRWFGDKRRPLPEKGVKGGCFVEDARGNWYVCFQVEIERDNAHGNGEIGIDLGLKHLVTSSNGEKIENPKIFKQYEEKLAKAQRAGNKKRAKAIHAKIKNSRQDFLHKLSSQIIKENQLVVVGNVNATKLMKTRFAKSVSDVSWSTLREQLRYKASRHGVKYLEVDEAFTTQTCSSCGDCSTEERPKGIAGLGIREWKCSSCGTLHDRDVNAAKNILKLGLSTQPPVEESLVISLG